MRNDPSAAPTYTVDDWLAAAGAKNDAATIPGRLVRLVNALSTAAPGQLNTNDPVATRIADRQGLSSSFSTTPPTVPKWFCCNAVLRFGTIQEK